MVEYLEDDKAEESYEDEEGEKPYEEIPLHLGRGALDTVEAAIFERSGAEITERARSVVRSSSSCPAEERELLLSNYRRLKASGRGG